MNIGDISRPNIYVCTEIKLTQLIIGTVTVHISYCIVLVHMSTDGPLETYHDGYNTLEIYNSICKVQREPPEQCPETILQETNHSNS